METLVAPTINLLCLLALLGYYLRKPMIEFAKTRSVTVRGELEKVREELRAAQSRHAEFTSKLKAMDAEVAALKAQAIQDAQAMKSRISAESQKMAANIVSDARSASVVLYTEFKDQLYSELGVRVLERAEKILSERLTGDDRARIRKEFASQVGAAQ
jgi:F0F1-type ATP synthase membrane subunit b/b'